MTPTATRSNSATRGLIDPQFYAGTMVFIESLQSNPVVPVAAFGGIDQALRTAELLLKHSITVLEITLRTEAAYECIKAVSKSFPAMIVGAGSVLDPEGLKRACGGGAFFGVAPCMDDRVLSAAEKLGVPFVPGIATPSELSRALERTDVVKIFPAASLGGPDYIKAITAPFRMKRFYLVPTGGVSDANYLQYLETDRVISVGMTYPVESSLLEKGDYAAVEERIRRIAAGIPKR